MADDSDAAISSMISLILAAATVTLAIPTAPALDVERLLDAIAEVEAWDGKTPGASGEWTRWQMLPSVWLHCRTVRKTMIQATPSEHRAAARQELLFRIATAQINHMTVTPYLCGLLWGAGVSATINHKAGPAKHEYATHIMNCYEAAKKP